LGFGFGQTRTHTLDIANPIHPRSVPKWVEQDSNLRRHCHQIYSLAPLAAWVSTRMVPDLYRVRVVSRPQAAAKRSPEKTRRALLRAELAVRLELTTLGLQNRSSAN